MLTKKQFKKAIDFQAHLDEQLKNPKFRMYYDEFGRQLEIAYQILQMRKRLKMSQKELARKLSTSQSNIARIEAGQQNLTIQMLQRIAKAYKRDLKIEFV